jgi:hypothetical protein
MYSIIIPTMWMSNLDKFLIQLGMLNSYNRISEILIIDNNINNLSVDRDLIKNIFSKVHIFPMSKNIYVNPAWNFGVNRSKEEYIVLLNDDLFTTPSIDFLLELHYRHTHKDIGVFGMNETCYPAWYNDVQNNIPLPIESNVCIEPSDGYALGWGCMIIMHRDKWVKIPEEIKIWFGDNFIANNFTKNKHPIYAYHNVVCSDWSQTVSELDINDILEKDRINYNRIINENT